MIPAWLTWEAAKKAAPVIGIGLVVFALVFLWEAWGTAAAQRDKAQFAAHVASEAAEENARQAKMQLEQAEIGRQTAADLQTRLDALSRSARGRQVAIKNARNSDATVRSWADQPVPDIVRGILSRPADEDPVASDAAAGGGDAHR